MALASIYIPDVGEGVTEVELVEWNVKPGDRVREDDVIAAVMTDKATVEIPSLFSGEVVSLGGEIGQVLAVGAELVTIRRDDGGASEADDAGDADAGNPPEEGRAPAVAESAGPAPVPEPAPTPAAPLGRPEPAKPGIPQTEPTAPDDAPLATPRVRARARAEGIDLRKVKGSGPAGRVTDADLAAWLSGGARPATGGQRARRSGKTETKVTGLRRRIAERMTEANARIPHITVVEEVDVSAIEDLRGSLNQTRGDRPKLTLLPFICAAICRAVEAQPAMNAHYDDQAGIFIRHAPVHIGIATMTEAGLMVPVVRHAEALGLFEAATEIARLSAAARSGKASRDELTGSTITVTSLGPLGAIATTPIINPPEVAVIGINKMAIRPMWDDHQFVPRRMMNISASFDHRMIDGWHAATFVQQLKLLLEQPARIFIGDDA